MSVYTVHQPPLRPAQAAPDPERFAFVRDGFSIWAFLFSALWMLRYRMWLVLLIYLVLATGIEWGLRAVGVSGPFLGLVGLLISVLVGIEAGTLRRFTLSRRGWKNVGIVSGDDLEDAERRFFTAWCGSATGRAVPPPPPPPSGNPPSSPSPPPSTAIVGLFPEPGAGR